ncbi:MAG: 5-formyltetrahydrofolate cyclo-ligase [Promethearchaeota archaeon]
MEFPKDPASLRKLILSKRKLVPLEIRQKKFTKIVNSFKNTPEFKKSQHILAYFGKVSSAEFDTKELLQEIIQSGRHLYLPRCAVTGIALEIYEIRDLDADIEVGAFGIMEPIVNKKTLIPVRKMDIVLVPGSVFDKLGNRYGYGAGYYDSLLVEYQGNSVAFAMDLAVMDFTLQTHSLDIPLKMLITESNIYRNE